MKRLVFLILLGMTLPLAAKMDVYSFDDPDKESRYKQLIAELRCLVCQNQNLADSNAELAQDLRKQVYEMIEQGNSNRQITDYMVQRYGEFVLYRPAFSLRNLMLWLGPILILLIALIALIRFVRQRQHLDRPLVTEREHAQADQLLSTEKKDDRP